MKKYPEVECPRCGLHYLGEGVVCTGHPRGSHKKTACVQVPQLMSDDVHFRVVLRGWGILAPNTEAAQRLAVLGVAQRLGGGKQAHEMAERLAPFIDVEEVPA